ncbi:hypothetical protein ASPCAL04705 [Aspergillus calidoustus]|uniref:Uncharacterized protein n=1 Tax=Aspergillus calidoustus TaxID=454130 RepID=A0A0U5G243_ASPCI|nr:hypothetical protein ASPCAL04705 [Aspergillus calidoustus]
MPSDQRATTPKGKAKQDRVPALKNPSVESRLGESSTASKNKPKWYQKVLDFAKRKPPADRRPDENCTLYIGRPTEKARVDFRPGFGPYVIILHGEVSKCCEWWYLADHEIPRDEDRKRCDKIQLPELKIVYEWGKSEQFTCGKRIHLMICWSMAVSLISVMPASHASSIIAVIRLDGSSSPRLNWPRYSH